MNQFTKISKNVIIIFIMTVVTWGMLAKSLEDDETIEEAIDRLIAAHNEDEESHLDDGQSLQSHKASEIIDHVIASIVADKLSASEHISQCSFESLDNWNQTGSVSLDGWPGVALYFEDGAVELSALSSTIKHSGNWLSYSKDMLFQFVGWVSSDANNTIHAILGGYSADDNLEGFGFQIVDGTVKGFWGDGASPTFTADLGVDFTVAHVFRVLYSAIDKNCKYYIDGVLKATISDIEPVGDFEPDVVFRVATTDETDGNFYVRQFSISRGI